jgi:NADPH:quinone reductase-like Zn-dependent oxidoreductase
MRGTATAPGRDEARDNPPRMTDTLACCSMRQENSMKAIVYHQYGSPDVLELQEIEKPVVKDDEVLVRVHAASVNPVDWHTLIGTPYLVRIEAGLLKPKSQTFGVDLAGKVEAVGTNVKLFQPGDEVFGGRNGAFAEYVCVREDRSIVPKPANMTFEQAAAVPIAALTALQGLRNKGAIRSGQKVLINGASGGVGTFAVQIAKAFGADVTAVCSTRNVDMVRSIGADQVIDYTQDDFTQDGQRYDVMLDMVATHSLSECRRVLRPKGVYVSVGAVHMGDWISPLTHVLKVLVASRVGSQRMVGMLTKLNKEDLLTMKELLEAGKVIPVIDRRFTLSEVPEALRYLGEGHAQGKVIITV